MRPPEAREAASGAPVEGVGAAHHQPPYQQFSISLLLSSLKSKIFLSRFSFFCFGLESFQNELETLSTETLSTQKVAGNIIYGLRFHRILGNIIRNNIQKSQMLPVFG